jgi:hypothetical protein
LQAATPRHDDAEVIGLGEDDKVILLPVRRFTDHGKVQQPFVQLLRHLLRIAAGDVVPEIGIPVLEALDFPGKIPDLAGLRRLFWADFNLEKRRVKSR